MTGEWECGSCGAIIDRSLAEPGELYHAPDADCRSVAPFKAPIVREVEPVIAQPTLCTKDYQHPPEHEALEHPYRVEVYVDGTWSGNALRFVSTEEAEAYGADLLSRWLAPTDSRVIDTRTGAVP